VRIQTIGSEGHCNMDYPDITAIHPQVQSGSQAGLVAFAGTGLGADIRPFQVRGAHVDAFSIPVRSRLGEFLVP